jgi:hypothetical protein
MKTGFLLTKPTRHREEVIVVESANQIFALFFIDTPVVTHLLYLNREERCRETHHYCLILYFYYHFRRFL